MPGIRSTRALVIGCAASLATGAACHRSSPAEAPYPATAAVWRQAGEVPVIAPVEQEPIYRSVLHFYRPGPQQARWLDLAFLPDAAGADAGRIDGALAARLLAELGPNRFCVQGAPDCPQDRGGLVRLSRPWRVNADTVRVVVRYEGDPGPYAPGTAFSGVEGFLLVRAGGDWKIAEHRPVAVQP